MIKPSYLKRLMNKIIPAQTALEILKRKIDQSGILSKSELKQLLNGQLTENYPKFSHFKAPVTNTTPTKELDILQLHQAISGNYYKKVTEQFRALEPGEAKGEFKKNRFDHCINLKHEITWIQLTICK